VEVSVLGSTEVRRDHAPVDLGTRKQRALVAALALHRGRPVSADALIDMVWGDSAPAAVGASLQSYIAGLRRSLEPHRQARTPATVLVTVGTAYALRVPPEKVDAARFEQRVSELHHRIATAGLTAAELTESVSGLDSALDLWRGTPIWSSTKRPTRSPSGHVSASCTCWRWRTGPWPASLWACTRRWPPSWSR
jgi:DNA-binding SARP family transcriptional activator